MGIFKHDCKIHGHRYQPRYDEVFPQKVSLKYGTSEILNSMKNKIYICDICKYCGHKIERDE